MSVVTQTDDSGVHLLSIRVRPTFSSALLTPCAQCTCAPAERIPRTLQDAGGTPPQPSRWGRDSPSALNAAGPVQSAGAFRSGCCRKCSLTGWGEGAPPRSLTTAYMHLPVASKWKAPRPVHRDPRPYPGKSDP